MVPLFPQLKAEWLEYATASGYKSVFQFTAPLVQNKEMRSMQLSTRAMMQQLCRALLDTPIATLRS